MRTFLLYLFVISSAVLHAQQTGSWKYLGGELRNLTVSTKTEHGVEHAVNYPGPSYYANSWIDEEGNLWFQKTGDGIWKYNRTTGLWIFFDFQINILRGGTTSWTINNYLYTWDRKLDLNDSENWDTLDGYLNIDSESFFQPSTWVDSNSKRVNLSTDLHKLHSMGLLDPFIETTFLVTDLTPTYGTKGVKSKLNSPGRRRNYGGFYNNGKVFIYGGKREVSHDDDYYSDLWCLDLSDTIWTWIGGDTTVNNTITEGPGARLDPILFGKDSLLYLFSGENHNTDDEYVVTNALWKYNMNTLSWDIVSGTTEPYSAGEYTFKNRLDSTITPHYRKGAISWFDGSDLFIYGGKTENYYQDNTLADFMRFNLETEQWEWIDGNKGNENWDAATPGIYGSIGIDDSRTWPGARSSSATCTDSLGNLWLFGGTGLSDRADAASGHLNDLWRFDTTTSNWTWISGPSSMIDYRSKIENPSSTSYYTKVLSPSTLIEKGEFHPDNQPLGRDNAVCWVNNNKLWVHGGFGYLPFDSVSRPIGTNLNDTWCFDLDIKQWTQAAGDTSHPSFINVTTEGNYHPLPSNNLIHWYDSSFHCLDIYRLNDLYLWTFDEKTYQWSYQRIDPSFSSYSMPLNDFNHKAFFYDDINKIIYLIFDNDDTWSNNRFATLDLKNFDWSFYPSTYFQDYQGQISHSKYVKYPIFRHSQGRSTLGDRNSNASFIKKGNHLLLFGGYSDYYGHEDRNSLFDYNFLDSTQTLIKGSSNQISYQEVALIKDSLDKGIYNNTLSSREQANIWISGDVFFVFGGDAKYSNENYNSSFEVNSSSRNDMWSTTINLDFDPNLIVLTDSVYCPNDTAMIKLETPLAENQIIKYEGQSLPGDSLSFVIKTDTSIVIEIYDTVTNSIYGTTTLLSIKEFDGNLFSNHEEICKGSPINSQQIQPNYRYLWTPNESVKNNGSYFSLTPHDSVTYRVNIYDSVSRCSANDTLIVNVKTFEFNSGQNDYDLCFGNSIIKQFPSDNYYSWTPSNLVETQGNNYYLRPNDTTLFILNTYDYSTQCRDYDTITINVNQFQYDIGENRYDICKGENIFKEFNNQYLFEFNPNTHIQQVDNNHYFTPEDTTKFQVISTDPITNCSDLDTITVNVKLCVGLFDNRLKQNLSYFPNPIITKCYIEGITTGTLIEVIDMSGDLIIKEPYSINGLNMSHLQQGLYLIKVDNQVLKVFKS